jgi:hypothetical protein
MDTHRLERFATRFAQHIGDTLGQHTTLVLAPDRGFGLVLLTNAEPGGGSVTGDALTAASRNYLGLDEQATQVGIGHGISFAPDTTPLELTSNELAAYAGRFATPADAVSLRVDGDQLLVSIETLDLPGQVNPAIPDQVVVDYPVSVISGDRLSIGSNVAVAYTRKPNGEIGWLRTSVRTAPLVSASSGRARSSRNRTTSGSTRKEVQ